MSLGDRWQREKFGLDTPVEDSTAPPKSGLLSTAEILEGIHELARSGEGADRRWALRILTEGQTTAITLPDPMDDDEVITRMSMMMKGAGARLTQISYRRAFPNVRVGTMLGGDLPYDEATDEMRRIAARITSLKLLNKKFPEANVGHVPKGFPTGRSLAVKADWCREQALKLLVERERKERQSATKEIEAAHQEIKEETDATFGTSST